MVVYSLAAACFGRLVTLGASPIAGSDLLLCAVFGGLISGVGSGATIRAGGAIDGIEVLAVIFARRLGVTARAFVRKNGIDARLSGHAVPGGDLHESQGIALYR